MTKVKIFYDVIYIFVMRKMKSAKIRWFDMSKDFFELSSFMDGLAHFRGRENLTLKEIAEKVGVSVPLVGNWSSGQALPNWPSIKKLIDMGMYIEEIFGTDTAFNARIFTEETDLKNIEFSKKFNKAFSDIIQNPNDEKRVQKANEIMFDVEKKSALNEMSKESGEIKILQRKFENPKADLSEKGKIVKQMGFSDDLNYFHGLIEEAKKDGADYKELSKKMEAFDDMMRKKYDDVINGGK